MRDHIMLSPGKQDSQEAIDADLIAGEIYIRIHNFTFDKP